MKRALPLLALGLVACGNEPPASDTPRTERSLPVQAVEIAPRDLSRVVRVSSPVEPLRRIRLASRTDGVLVEVLVEEGDDVTEGQLLARLDTSEQRAELMRAEARLRERTANFERLERLRQTDHVDAASYEAARAELAVANSEVELWRTRVDFGEVRASISSTVIARSVEPGEAVNRNQPIFELADLSALVVRVGVSELDVHELGTGAPVRVDVDAITDSGVIEGTVRRIFPAADTASRLVTVEIELPGAQELGVRPGYLARATLQVDQRANVLAVPAAALAETENGHYVMVIGADDRLERREVTAGVSRGGWREITAGLRAGERIVATNPLDLNEGTRVRIVGWAG